VNMQEVGKEIFGHLGYADGTRFFTVENPQVIQLQQQLQQAMGLVQQLQGKLKEKMTGHQVGLVKTQATNDSKEKITVIKEENENKRSLATHFAALSMHDNPPKKEANGKR
jgi:hypothetical protein